MADFIIWGTGDVAEYCFEIFPKSSILRENKIIAFVDSDLKKQGREFHGYPIISPDEIRNFQFDFISIWVWWKRKEIEDYIIHKLMLPAESIADIFSPFKNLLFDRYKLCEDEEIKKIIRKVKAFPRPQVYNFDPVSLHKNLEVFSDDSSGLNYIIFENKRMYLSREYQYFFEREGKKYISGDMWEEQDLNSPHLYEENGISVQKEDVIVDAGVCEGNFTLHHIEKVKRAYLFEGDHAWVEALSYTFKPYKDKIIIVDKFLGHVNNNMYTTMDSVVQEKVNFIKMDIEGAEIEALSGAEKVLSQKSEIQCAICTYHKHDDEKNIGNILKKHGFRIEFSRGYMLPVFDEYVLNVEPEFRHGIIRGVK